MGVHIIFETVVVIYIGCQTFSIVVVTLPCLLRSIFTIKSCIIARLQRKSVRQFVLVVQLQLGVFCAYIHRLKLIARRLLLRRVTVCGTILIAVVVIGCPAVMA